MLIFSIGPRINSQNRKTGGLLFLLSLVMTMLLTGFTDHRNGKPFSPWLTNLEQAERQAQKDQKAILVCFSGSDWCRPCMLLEKGVFESKVFTKFAKKNLHLVRIDFPARKKNRLSEEQAAYNEHLAERYNQRGEFPLVVLLDKDGNVAGRISGYQREGAGKYVAHLKRLIGKMRLAQDESSK